MDKFIGRIEDLWQKAIDPQTWPAKFSRRWARVWAVYFAVILAFLFLSQLILRADFSGSSVWSLIMMAVFSAFITCLGGFLGGRFYFLICSLGIFFGIIYLMYTAIANPSLGWGDLTSIIGFLLWLVVSLVIGILAELVFFIKRIK